MLNQGNLLKGGFCLSNKVVVPIVVFPFVILFKSHKLSLHRLLTTVSKEMLFKVR